MAWYNSGSFLSPHQLSGAIAGQYANAHRVDSDIRQLTMHFPDLKPKLDLYTYPDGRQQNLIRLTGTIPISYQRNTYNIPICIWVLGEHPGLPPTVYVVPTAEMEIRAGEHVDGSGRVYLPELHGWLESSSLVHLVQKMCEVFSRVPPLFSRPAGQQRPPPPQHAPQPSQQNPPARPPPPAHPYGGGGGGAAGKAEESGLDADLIRMSLHSCVEDNVMRRLRELHSTVAQEVQERAQTRDMLIAGSNELERITEELAREQATVAENIRILTEKEAALKASLSQLKTDSDGAFDIDAAVTATRPLYKQLLELVAKDNAIDDAIYHLDRALGQGVLPLPQYLKHLRILASNQFRTRRLIMKARRVGGLED